MRKNERAGSLSSYRIFESEQFIKDLHQDFKGQQDKIVKKLHFFVYPQLKENPYFGKNIKKLKDYTPDTWRYRIGDFRFFYTIQEAGKVVLMITAATRADAY